MDDGGFFIPVNVPVGLGQLGGVGRERLFLRDGRGGIAVGVLPEHFHHETPAEIGQLVVHGGGGVVDADAERALEQHGARIKPALHAHDGDAREMVAVHDRPLDGGRAPVLGQERAVDVERPDGRDVQHGLGQDEAVGGDDQRVGAEPGERGAVGFVLEVERLEDRDAEFLRQHLDGGRLELVPAPGGAVGLAIGGDDLAAGPCRHMAEHRGGEVRRPHEYDAHFLFRGGHLFHLTLTGAFLELAFKHHPLEAADPVDKQLAVQLIDFMLDADG